LSVIAFAKSTRIFAAMGLVCSACMEGNVRPEECERSALPSGEKATAKSGRVIHANLVTHKPGNIFETYARASAKVGSGKYGSVCKAYHLEDKSQKLYAIKTIAKKGQQDDKLQMEISYQRAMDHPNIAKVFESFSDYHNYYMVLELCSGGELFDRITKKQSFSEAEAAGCMEQIFRAVKYMHSRSVCHRDLKPENLLLLTEDDLNNNLIKVIDFGCSSAFGPEQPMKTRSGSPFYIAPEVLTGKYGPECDLWSCGCILYILLCGYPPFNSKTVNGILEKVKKGRYEYPAEDWSHISDDAKNLVDCLLKSNPQHRHSPQQAEDHVWVVDKAASASASSAGVANLGGRIKDFRSADKFKKAALHVVAWNMDDSQVEGLRKSFLAHDKNGDGQLSMTELQECLESGGSVSLPEDLKQMIEDMDTDGSGKIDYTEFLAATIDKKHAQQEEVVWQAFRTFDKNGDGTISPSELSKIVENEDFAHMVGETIISDLLKEVDTDGDGQISFDEFMNMLKDHGAASF